MPASEFEQAPTTSLGDQPSDPLPQALAPVEEEDDDDDIDLIFRKAYAAEPTQPLPPLLTPQEQRAKRHAVLALYVFVVAYIGGAIVGVVTYPTVTIEVVPISQTVSYATPLPLLLRTLAPVTLARTGSAPTTGHGHQEATTATGIITWYNGRFAPQTVPPGRVLTGSDGMQVLIAQSVTIPAASTQQVGTASVAVQARRAGVQGNLPALDINLAVSSDLLAKNLTAFTGGRDARDYQAVAASDLQALTAQLKQALTQALPQAFSITPREAAIPTDCHDQITADHGIGEEAHTVTVRVAETCAAVAYDQDELQRQATAAFTAHATPGVHYQLASRVQVRVTSVSPLTVTVSGVWVYLLTPDDQAVLAQQIAGDSPTKASAVLLQTGVITHATVPQQLPRDPGHIQFRLVIGA